MRIHLFILALTAVATVTAAIPITDYCDRAASRCKFSFEAVCGIPTFSLDGAPDTPITPRLVFKDATERLGMANMNNIPPEFLYSYYYVPAFVRGMSHSQFRPVTFSSNDGSAIGFEPFDGNKDVARGQCVRVYFTAYQKYVAGVLENVSLSPEQARRDDQCVVFRTM